MGQAQFKPSFTLCITMSLTPMCQNLPPLARGPCVTTWPPGVCYRHLRCPSVLQCYRDTPAVLQCYRHLHQCYNVTDTPAQCPSALVTECHWAAAVHLRFGWLYHCNTGGCIIVTLVAVSSFSTIGCIMVVDATAATAAPHWSTTEWASRHPLNCVCDCVEMQTLSHSVITQCHADSVTSCHNSPAPCISNHCPPACVPMCTTICSTCI